MNGEQARELCGKIGELKVFSVVNEKERERGYKEAIASNDPYILAGVIKTISGRKKARELQGKKRNWNIYSKIKDLPFGRSFFTEECL